MSAYLLIESDEYRFSVQADTRSEPALAGNRVSNTSTVFDSRRLRVARSLMGRVRPRRRRGWVRRRGVPIRSPTPALVSHPTFAVGGIEPAHDSPAESIFEPGALPLLVSQETCPYVGGSNRATRRRVTTAARDCSRRNSVGHTTRASRTRCVQRHPNGLRRTVRGDVRPVTFALSRPGNGCEGYDGSCVVMVGGGDAVFRG
jgi:hypothetical protein